MRNWGLSRRPGGWLTLPIAAEQARDAAARARDSAEAHVYASQAADDAFRIAVEKELAEQAELQAGLDAQAADGADPEKPASLLDIIKERIGPAALSLLLNLVGVTDLVNCFKGQISGCLWTLVGVIPAAKIAKAAPIVRRLISKTDEIVDALHSRKTLKSRQLDEIHNLPACPTFRPASYLPAATFHPAFANTRGSGSLPPNSRPWQDLQNSLYTGQTLPRWPLQGSRNPSRE